MMHEKSLLRLFLILNVALAGAFAGYLFLSANHPPKVAVTSFLPKPNPTKPAQPVPAPRAADTNLPAVGLTKDKALLIQPPGATPASNAVTPKLTSAHKKFTWQDVEAETYVTYLENLRLSGCPDDKIRQIVLADIEELFAKRRLQLATDNDVPWWRGDLNYQFAATPLVVQEKSRRWAEERRLLIAKLLGPEAVTADTEEAPVTSLGQLTGPVLGALSGERLSTVQQLCSNATERRQKFIDEAFTTGQPLNQVELAKLREQTRADLRRVLNPQEMEEFLLRNSQNATVLRDELSGLTPTPEEFRKVFRAVDPIDHALQLEFGGPEALSEKQRERWQRQREAAVQESLRPERYQAYVLTRHPQKE